MLKKVVARISRHKRIRGKISGNAERPRLSIFRSNAYIYAQVIDDVAGKTLAAASDLSVKKGTKLERASEVGKAIAEACKKAKIEKVVCDRGGFIYTGRVKALAEAARESGLQF